MLDIDAVRHDFPILATQVGGRPLAYLDNAATTQKPQAVLDRLLAFYRAANSNVHRGVHHLSELASEQYEAARETARAFLNAHTANEIVFTSGTTDAINMLADCFGACCLKPGDELIVTAMEHHSNLVPWQMLCRRYQAKLRILPFDDSGALQLDQLGDLLSERTRLIALSHVSNVLGRVNPVAEVVRRAHARDIPVLVDAAQSAPHIPLDVRQLGCDFLALSGHKMYAATGIGVLYAREDWLERLPPARYGGGMVDRVTLQHTTFAELPFKFEAGTPNIAGAVSLAAAIDYLRSLDLDHIAQHEDAVMHHAMERLGALDGLMLYGSGGDKCGAISFNLDGLAPYDVALILDQLGVAIRSGTHCAEPVMQHYGVTQSLRASLGVYNTTDEIDRLIDGLRRARTMLA